jgi:hypothetical protein
MHEIKTTPYPDGAEHFDCHRNLQVLKVGAIRMLVLSIITLSFTSFLRRFEVRFCLLFQGD